MNGSQLFKHDTSASPSTAAMLSASAFEELSNRISALDCSIQETGSPLVKGLVSLSKEPEPEPEPVGKPLSPATVIEDASQDASWQDEWARLRFDELRLTGQLERGDSEASVQKRDAPLQWAERNQPTVAWQRENGGWSEEQSIAYTCVALGGQMAMAQALRDGVDRYACSVRLIQSVLRSRAAASVGSAPLTYRHLSGRFSLTASDPAWSTLLEPGAKPGCSFTTSAVTIASDDPRCFDAKGRFCVPLSTSKRLYHELQDSEVVCFRGVPMETVVDTRSPIKTRAARSLVQVSSVGWHLPPLATVTLEQIVPPGGWTAYGRPVARKLYEVSVSFSC